MSRRSVRDSFHLEVDDWGDWVFEKEFLELNSAQVYGKQFFPQNAWRIVNARSKAVIFVYDPLEAMADTAATEIQRFQSRDRWMERFIRDREVRAARLRGQGPQPQMSPEEEEIAFGPESRGVNQPWFNADGLRRGRIPNVADALNRQPTPHPARRLIEVFADEDDDDVYCRPKREKYNWQEEGF